MNREEQHKITRHQAIDKIQEIVANWRDTHQLMYATDLVDQIIKEIHNLPLKD